MNICPINCSSGAADSIREYYQQSVEAEDQANRATSDPHGPVEQSTALRQATETTVNAIQGEFALKQQLQVERLNKLTKGMEQDDLSTLSLRVIQTTRTQSQIKELTIVSRLFKTWTHLIECTSKIL